MLAALILDLIIVLIIVFCAIISAKHGFVRTVVEVAGFLAAFVIAFTISSPLANATYDKIIEPKIVENVQDASVEGTQSVTQKIWDALPGIFKNNSLVFC